MFWVFVFLPIWAQKFAPYGQGPIWVWAHGPDPGPEPIKCQSFSNLCHFLHVYTQKTHKTQKCLVLMCFLLRTARWDLSCESKTNISLYFLVPHRVTSPLARQGVTLLQATYFRWPSTGAEIKLLFKNNIVCFPQLIWEISARNRRQNTHTDEAHLFCKNVKTARM